MAKKYVAMIAVVVAADSAEEAIAKTTGALGQPIANLSATASAAMMILGLDSAMGTPSPNDPADQIFRHIMQAPDPKEGA